MTTVDPETGNRDKHFEPLRSLRKFRLAKGKDAKQHDYGNDPLVGMNLVIIKEGPIAVGDPVILKSKL